MFTRKGKIVIAALVVVVVLVVGFLVVRTITRDGDGTADGSQTVGSLSVSPSANATTVEELAVPPGSKDPIAPVIGKAYRVTAEGALKESVRIRVAYDPAVLDARVPEAALRLYKWHDARGGGFWARVPSRVDTDRNEVTAELNTFSILSVRAPLVLYLSSAEVARLEGELSRITKSVPKYTCGVSIVVDEELLVWDGSGDLVESYLRGDPEETGAFDDCVGNPSDPATVMSFSHQIERSRDAQRVQYDMRAALVWQTDAQESAVVRGVITDQNGKPLPGVTVRAEKTKYDPATTSTVSGDNGAYELKLHSGRYAVTARGAKHCASQEWRAALFAWGTLPAPPSLHESWAKNFTLRCADYYIDDTVTTPLSWSMLGMQFSGSAQHRIEGVQSNPVDGGYGWEGAWTLDYSYRTSEQVTGGVAVGPASATPISGVVGDVSYDNVVEYRFNLPSKPTVGTVIPITGKAKDTYTVGGSSAGGAYIIDESWIVGSEFGGGSYQGTIGGAFTDTLTFIEVNGREGAVLQLGGGTTGEKVTFRIRELPR